MNAKIFQIVNSNGLRLRKTIFGADKIVIKFLKRSRVGWEKYFKLMSERLSIQFTYLSEKHWKSSLEYEILFIRMLE